MDQEFSEPQLRRTLKRHRIENFEERRVCRAAEPLLAKLHEGTNVLPPGKFKSLAEYFLSDNRRSLLDALDSGHFVVGGAAIRRKGGNS